MDGTVTGGARSSVLDGHSAGGAEMTRLRRSFSLQDRSLLGIGLYTPAEAARLTGVGAGKIGRWLRGHGVGERRYDRLWRPQIEFEDGSIQLGFRDLMEVRVAAAFIEAGVSPQKVRRAIEIGREIIGDQHPLSTTRFRTDGRTVFLQVMAEDGTDRMIDLLRNQYAFRSVIEPSLRIVEFGGDGAPLRWWPHGRAARIVIDPERSFGRPIEVESAVPTGVLAAAVAAEGSVEAAARLWKVTPASVRRAVEFQQELGQRRAA
jgi:uncharacterized protein (DUF433 family)